MFGKLLKAIFPRSFSAQVTMFNKLIVIWYKPTNQLPVNLTRNSGEKKSVSKFNYSLLLLVMVLMLFAKKDVTFREGKLKAYLNVDTENDEPCI